jgi:two-component system sensor kinase FixL
VSPRARILGTIVVGIGITVGALVFVRSTMQRTDETSRQVVHTQEVLAALEQVLASAVSAQGGVERYFRTGDIRDADSLNVGQQAVARDLDRLATLTADNPIQQQRIAALRQALSDTAASLNASVTARRESGARGAAELDAANASLTSAHETLREMRVDENRLLTERVRADQAAVRRLRITAIGVVAGAGGLLVSLVWLLSRDATRERQRASNLTRVKDGLELEVDARAVELRDTNARLQSIIDSAVDGIIVIDSRGRIEAFNRGAERLFGYPTSEVIGRNVSMLMPSPDHEQHDGYLSRYLATGEAKIIGGAGREVTGRRRDGTTLPLHLSVGEMSIGGERKFTGMLHDLTRRAELDAQLRASEARWRAIIESAVDGIVVIDGYGRIEAFNPAAERLFGYVERDVVGKNVNILMPSPYREEHDAYLARYHATGVPKIIGIGREVTGLRHDGTVFPVHLSVGEMLVGGQRKFTGILHDLSARVRIEEQLREQSTLARLGEMAAVIAHEVKNPLAGIRGAIQIIGGRLPEGSKDAAVAKEIIGRIDALNTMMKDMLLFARPPSVRSAPVEIDRLVARTADLLSSDPAFKEVRVEIQGSAPALLADAELLQIVFQNLLVNGAHAMQGGGTIRVSVRADDSTCQITFSDTGPGIPPEHLDKIFTPFFTTKSRGSGLGLPTAKRLIEAHRGVIGITCPPAGGTTVTIQLPVSAQAV